MSKVTQEGPAARPQPAALVWVTGASQGIGRAMTQTVPWLEARVIGVSREGRDSPEWLRADLSEPAGWEILEDSFERELAGFHGERAVLVHAAASIEPIGFTGDSDPAVYRRSVVLNAVAPLVLGESFLRVTRELTCRRQLVLLSSGAAQRPYPGLAAYCAAKAAVDQWVRTVGVEQAGRAGAQVLSVIPGRVDTAMHERLRSADEDQLPERAEFVRLHREGVLRDPEDVARQLWALLERHDVGCGEVIDLGT